MWPFRRATSSQGNQGMNGANRVVRHELIQWASACHDRMQRMVDLHMEQVGDAGRNAITRIRAVAAKVEFDQRVEIRRQILMEMMKTHTVTAVDMDMLERMADWVMPPPRMAESTEPPPADTPAPPADP